MKSIDGIYEEWCGCSRLENSVKLVHDSTEAIEFAEYYHKEETKNLTERVKELERLCRFACVPLLIIQIPELVFNNEKFKKWDGKNDLRL